MSHTYNYNLVKEYFNVKPTNCVSGEAIIGTAQNFSIRMNCLEDFKNVSVIGFNEINESIEFADQYNFHNNGPEQCIEQCIELTLSDGRTLVCTPDQYISTTYGWIMAKDLTVDLSRVHVTYTPPLILPYDNRNWSLSLTNNTQTLITLKMRDEYDMYQTFAFARLCGFLAFTGFHINSEIYAIRTDDLHKLDMQQLDNDLRLVSDTGFIKKTENFFHFGKELSNIFSNIVATGLRSIFGSFDIPNFLFNKDTPHDVICQYLSGLLGGAPQTHLFETSNCIQIVLRSCRNREPHMICAIKKLITLFDLVGVENCYYTRTLDNTYRINTVTCILSIPTNSIFHLTKYIGVAYNFKKSMQLCTINSYHREINFLRKNNIKSNFSTCTFNIYTASIGATDYFTNNHTTSHPLAMKLVKKKTNVGNKVVHDIIVSNSIKSLSANGIIVSICPPASQAYTNNSYRVIDSRKRKN